MTNESSSASAGLPPGETDPNLIYIAVGKAIHSWEGLEEALATLFLKMMGTPDTPANLAAYGQANRRFSDRMIATRAAADAYFIKHPDQALEGEFKKLHTGILEMGIERHRIAHGHITRASEFKIPHGPKGSSFEVSATVLFRWGAPFYSTDNLRTDPIGVGAAQIDALTTKFMAMHNNVHAFTEQIA